MPKKKIQFEFCFEYNKDGSDDEVLTTEYVYSSNKSNNSNSVDSILITKRNIIIRGNRSKKTSFIDCLRKTNTAIYRELLCCVVFVYMTQGIPFKKGECELRIQNNKLGALHEKDFGYIKDICLRHLEKRFLLSPECCEKIFQSNKWAKTLLTSLSEFIVASNLNDTDVEILMFEYWKAFNSLYSFYYKETQSQNKRSTERSQLIEISNFIKTKSTEMSSVAEVKNYVKQILDFKIKAFLLSQKKTVKNNDKRLEHIKDTIMSCKDKRLIDIFKDIIDGEKEKFPFSATVREEINKYILGVKENSNVDLLVFAVVQYGYYLRCKFFHGEKSTPNFLVNNNPDVDEVQTVISLLKLLLIDLYKLINDELMSQVK